MNNTKPTANPEMMRAMQGLRRSSAASKHRNRAKYNRTVANRLIEKEFRA